MLHLVLAIAALSCLAWPVCAQDARPDSTVISDGYLPGEGAVELYVRVMGSGRDTVVVVHGGPGAGMNAILPHIAPLAEEATVIFFDQRGGGRSTLPADTSALHARYFVEDLDAARRHFGMKPTNWEGSTCEAPPEAVRYYY